MHWTETFFVYPGNGDTALGSIDAMQWQKKNSRGRLIRTEK